MHNEPPTEGFEEAAPRVVTVRVLVLTVLAAMLLSVVAAVAISVVVVGTPKPGPPGPAGEQGARGPVGVAGPAGTAKVDEDAVWEIVEGDPQRVTTIVEDNLDPAPADVQSNVEQVASDLSDLCSTLEFADALSSEVLSCP